MRTNEITLLLLLLLVVLLLITSPLITIWSINTLFHINIPTNLWTYLASLWLTGIVAGGTGAKFKW